MACVYRAHQQNLEREVAVKVLPVQYSADADFVERFKAEARAMGKLSHPNIVTVHDAGEEQGRLFIVMAYIRNGTLKDLMGQPMSPRVIVPIVNEVASALSYAHDHGIIHRDVKPVNVLIDDEGHAVLSDFGIVKMLSASSGLTRRGAGVGTPEYMSPEQCHGAPVDARADIYALGILVYEMLTGRTPFESDNYAALAHAHIYEPVPAPMRFNHHISPAVQSVVMKALSKEPADRFQSATDMAQAFEQAVAAQMPIAPRRYAAAEYTPPRFGVPGAPSAPAVLCPRCQQANSASQQYCSRCGGALYASGYAPVQPSVAPAPRSRPSGVLAMAHAFPICPRCATSNRPLNHFCTACGAPLADASVICANCGTLCAAGQRFCTACRHQLD
jgi:serine/threonine-protein kinase